MSKVTVVALMTAKEGHEADVQKAMLDCAAPTRQEAGCLNYDIHQSLKKPAEFMVHENWASMDALAAHGKTAHMAKLMSDLADKLAVAPKITLWKELQ